MESRYGPSIEMWPGASLHKPKSLETSFDPIISKHSILPSVEKKSEPESKPFNPLIPPPALNLSFFNEDKNWSTLSLPTSTSLIFNKKEAPTSWVPPFEKKEEKTSLSWALPPFTNNRTIETATQLVSTNRKTCHACGGTGEAPGITGIWRDTCWVCDGLGYHGPPPTSHFQSEQAESTAPHSIFGLGKENALTPNLPTIPTFKTLSAGDEFHPGGTHCRECGKFSNFNPCLDCDSKAFWKSFNDDDDDSDEYDADELGDDGFDED
jgi:hypothetical protein